MVRIANERELEENQEKYKQLYSCLDQVDQEGDVENEINFFQKSNFCVFSRVRPTFENEISYCPSIIAHTSRIDVHRPGLSVKNIPKFDSHSFNLHRVFDENASDTEVYKIVCKPLLDMVIKGASAAIISYGQTGSGKTHTTINSLKNIAKDLFVLKNMKYSLAVFEILGNNVGDLFNEYAEVTIQEDKFGQVQLSGLSTHDVENSAEFLSLIETAASRRRTRTTSKNDTSSRSHMIVKLEVENLDLETTSKGILHIVDLAGSETASDRSHHSKERLKETKLINTSLMTLKDCMRGRSLVNVSKNFIHIPYRASKLTLVLRECFELAVRRPVKVAIIACVNPLPSDSSHSLNTLRYASGIYVAPDQIIVKPDPKDPFYWDRKKTIEWITKEGQGKVVVDDLLPVGDGSDLVQIPEHEFIEKIMKSGKMTEKLALRFYLMLWRMVVDSRTKNRKDITRARKGLVQKQYLDHCERILDLERANSELI